MKKLLILIVFGAVYLHYYPQPLLTQWFDEEKQNLKDDFKDMSDTKVRLNPHKIYTDLEHSFSTFNKSEITELKNITTDRSTVRNFFEQHCSKQIPTPVIRQGNVGKICNVMQNYQSLF